MCRLLETIRVENLRFCHLEYHTRRFNRARAELFGATDVVDLEKTLSVPPDIGPETHKCRVTYSTSIQQVEFEPYSMADIRSLRVVEGDGLDYRFKYADRSGLAALRDKKGDCDEVLIVQNGLFTDASYANIGFLQEETWFTPATPLLHGTARARLLEEGRIKEADIGPRDIGEYIKVALFNAMIDLGACIVPIDRVFFRT